jgi:hypothetical protein
MVRKVGEQRAGTGLDHFLGGTRAGFPGFRLFCCLEPGSRHLQENVASPLGLGGFRPGQTFVSVLVIFLRRCHDTPSNGVPPLRTWWHRTATEPRRKRIFQGGR